MACDPTFEEFRERVFFGFREEIFTKGVVVDGPDVDAEVG